MEKFQASLSRDCVQKQNKETKKNPNMNSLCAKKAETALTTYHIYKFCQSLTSNYPVPLILQTLRMPLFQLPPWRCHQIPSGSEFSLVVVPPNHSHKPTGFPVLLSVGHRYKTAISSMNYYLPHLLLFCILLWLMLCLESKCVIFVSIFLLRLINQDAIIGYLSIGIAVSGIKVLKQ